MPLPDQDMQALKVMADNKILLDALKRLLFSRLVQSKLDGMKAVEDAFAFLETLQERPSQRLKDNPAR